MQRLGSTSLVRGRVSVRYAINRSYRVQGELEIRDVSLALTGGADLWIWKDIGSTAIA